MEDKIEYINISMTDIDKLEGSFDFVYSSLAFHYIEDFHKLMKDIYKLLNKGGRLLYSQEHPIVTATIDYKDYFDENKKTYTFSNYHESGKREKSF